MATWVTHLMIADEVLKRLPYLKRHEFCVGNIAPDCNIENEDWTSFTPPREVTHWMSKDRKAAADCDRFLHEYMEKKTNLDSKEESFLLGYYAHLITDAELQRFISDEERVKAVWRRVKQHPELNKLCMGMDETWDSVKVHVKTKEWSQDVALWEKEYLEFHPESGYFTDIIGLENFPDYIDYLPEGAIVRKVKFMGYWAEAKTGRYSNILMSREEFDCFVRRSVELIVEAIDKEMQKCR